MQDVVIGPHKKGKIRCVPMQSLFIHAIPEKNRYFFDNFIKIFCFSCF